MRWQLWGIKRKETNKEQEIRNWKNKDNNETFRRDATKINVIGKGVTFVFFLFFDDLFAITNNNMFGCSYEVKMKHSADMFGYLSRTSIMCTM